jgi:L-lactate dehydrogenase complex protein LldG
MTPAQRARMREVIGAAVKKGSFPGLEPPGSSPGASGHADSSLAHTGSPPGRSEGGEASAAILPVAPLPPAARFRAALEALAGLAHEAASVADAAAIVARIAAAHDARVLLSWDEEAIGLPGLADALAAHGLSSIDPEVPQRGPGRQPALEALAAIRVGLTGADVALADTGTIVLAAGPGRPRLASLLVPVHIAIVRPDRFLDSIETLFTVRPELAAQGSNLVCITGPSRTADIEHTLSRGVHGPGEVHAILMAE